MKLIQDTRKNFFFQYSILLSGMFFLSIAGSIAQDKTPVNFGKITAADFAVNSPLIDSNTNAVIVFDKGDISFEGNENGWFGYVLKRSKRIKVINKKGFDLATVELLLYRNNDTKEKVDKLSAVTYNMENGVVMESKLTSREVFEEQTGKDHYYKKFTMPAVKEGSIIEYSYTIKSDFIRFIPAWEFQSVSCPTLWSEYNVQLPGLLEYMTFVQLYHKFSVDKGSEGFQSYSIKRKKETGGGLVAGNVQEAIDVSSPTTIHRWVMKDGPAFSVENYISSPVNFIDKISFQLNRTYDGESFHDVANTWSKVSEELLQREDFGKPLLEYNGWLDKELSGVVLSNDNALQAAKKIYYYLQNNYTCTNHYDKFIKTSLQDVVKKKSGTVGDINLLMIAMLKHKNIIASPVLLSTREFGRNSKNYPQLERLNYVIGKIEINTTDYYLDATTRFLPFGKLPAKCYNDHARVISTADTSAVYFDANSLKENRMVSMIVINTDKNEVAGSYTGNMGFFESLDTKSSIAKSGIDKYKKNLQQGYPEDFLVSNIQVDSLQLVEEPVSVKFDFKLSSFENADIVYFNPLMGEGIKANPFYAAERLYPVEMPYTKDETYVLNMEIPKGYKIDELPKSARIMLNENEGMFEYLISADATAIQMRCTIVLKKANFSGADYQTLRDFYAYIVKKEAEQIVFKKIK